VSNVANLLRNDVTRAEVHRLCEANPQGILSIRCHDQEVDGWRFFLTPNDQDNGVDEMRGQRLGHDYHQNRLCAVERAANPADVLDYFYACSDWNL